MAGKKASKTKITEAALKCFIEKGIVGTSFKEIAQAAGVHQPLIKYHFKTFEELFASVIQSLLEDIKQRSIRAVEAHPNNPKMALLEYSVATLRWNKEKPQYKPIWTFFYHMASYNEYFRSINDMIRKVGRDRISLLLFQIQESEHSSLAEGRTIADLAYVIQSHITGDLVMSSTESRDIDQAIELSLNGISDILSGAFIKS